jgi:hypothetical protein
VRSRIGVLGAVLSTLVVLTNESLANRGSRCGTSFTS